MHYLPMIYRNIGTALNKGAEVNFPDFSEFLDGDVISKFSLRFA
jgi:hypothetical protein